MAVIPRIAEFAPELVEIRHDFHMHPEVGFTETRTAARVAALLAEWGLEVHTGIGRTGVVGVLAGTAGPGRSIGLRADMDALPMDEHTNLAFRSRTPGVFHGCGHDAHTTMLLGAARYLAEHRDFAGRVVFIFQPAEEGLGGARAMLADGLFERFPCDEIYGMHNNPLAAENEFGVKPGTAMAGASFFDITVRGIGSHGAAPHHSRDPIVIATALVQQLQSIVARNVPPTSAAVLSVTQIHSGSAYNVVPDQAVISGTVRYFEDSVRDLVHRRMETLCAGLAAAYEVEIAADIRPIFSVLTNDPVLSEAYVAAARKIVGDDKASLKTDLVSASEDFADMLQVVPGAYCTLGHKGSVPVHNPEFVIDDDMLPVGASILARIALDRLGA